MWHVVPEPVKEAPGKRKKEMAKQKAAPEAKKQKLEGNRPNEEGGGWDKVVIAQMMNYKGT